MTSKEIENIIKFFDELQGNYNFESRELKCCDDETQDYLHKLELEETDYHERAKIGTKLAKIRKRRRIHKDNLETLEPLLALSKKSECTRIKNDLRQALGIVRKIENKRKGRCYKNRVIQE